MNINFIKVRELIYLIIFAYPVAGRGVGCGRIPENSLLMMDQPAFYLQLEKTIQKIAESIKLQGKAPFLTHKELRYDRVLLVP